MMRPGGGGRGGGPGLGTMRPGPGEHLSPSEDALRFGRRELRVLAPYLRPHVRRALWAALLLLVSQGAMLSTPFFLRYGIDQGIVSALRHHHASAANLRALDLAAGLVFGTGLVAWWTMRRSIVLAGDVGERALQDVRIGVFRHLMGLDLGFFEREKAGRLVSRLTSDIETIELLVTEVLVQMGATVLYLVGSITVLFRLDLKLAGASLAFVLPLMTLATLKFRTRSARAYNLVRDRIATVLTLMQETVRGVHVVQAFGRERVNSSRFQEVNVEWRDANVESFRLGSRFFPVMELIGLGGTAVILGYGGWLTIHGALTIGTLTAFALYLTSTLEPIQTLSQLYDTFQSAMSGLAKLAGLLEERPDIVDGEGARDLDGVRGAAALENVTFRYAPGLPAALDDMDLAIRPGGVLALVGPTGAGKSSIAKLLLRFYDPSEGRVALDGHDLRDVRLDSLRRHTAIVPQEGFLFAGTVRDNIRFGRPDATDEEVERVCRRLGIDVAIRAFPDGYETEVRERGSGLSGGQRQLIALARALVADPRLLVLDEATSALDSGTEAQVEGALRLATEGRTTIVIAHRLSTASRADTVAVVDHGRIVEAGTHGDLVARGGLYARLYRHWLGAGAVVGAGRPDTP